jgi:hypothetical protein
MWRQSGRRLWKFGQKRGGLSKNSDYWRLGILEGASITGQLIHDAQRKNRNIPLSLPGGYPNFLTSNDREQLGSAYGSNASRLRELKRQYDPDNIFSSTIPLPS